MEYTCCSWTTCRMKLDTVCGLKKILVAGTRGIAKMQSSANAFGRVPSGRHGGFVLPGYGLTTTSLRTAMNRRMTR
jgi:hypothetical protein